MKVVLYDGDCGFCSSFVQFVWKRDRKGIVYFAAIQSERGRQLLEDAGIPRPDLKTMYFLDEDKIHERSDAGLLVFRLLPRYRILAFIGLIFPRSVRDFFYGLIARYRHRLPSGKCELPPSAVRERFLDLIK